MNWARLLPLFILTFITSATAKAQQFGRTNPLHPLRPRLDPEQDEMVISTGTALKLRCQSASPVRWQIPQEAEESAVKRVLFEEKEPDYPYIIHLEVPKVEYMQTGFYRCLENITTDVEDGSKVASIYVYVSDPENLLAIEEYPPPITVDGNGRLVIPCRPTSPNVTVTLKRDGEEILVGDENDVTYDPKTGYTYFKPHVIDSGEMTCTGVSGNHSSTSNFEVHIPNIAEDVAAPSIHAPNHAIIDSTLELNCSVPFDFGVAVDLNWDVPDRSGRDSGRIVPGKLKEIKETLRGGGEQLLALLTLTIKKVLPSDEGNYECTVKDNANNQKTVHKFIPVLEKGASYINLTVQGGKKNITAKADDPSVQWVVYHTAHPEPLLIWYDPDGKEIVSSSKYEVLKDASTTRLMIKKPSIQDTGVYKLKATNYGTSKTEELFLNVLGGPDVNVSIEPFYMVNREAEVQCFVLGNPTPVVRWSFRPCNFAPLEDCEPREEDELNAEDFTEDAFGKVQLKSKLNIFASRPGRLRCMACNVAGGCVSKDVNFYVTDVPNGFHLSGPNLTVNGETITLKCSASVFHFYRHLTWTLNNSLLNQDGNYDISDSSEALSHHSMLVIKNATKTNEGLYSCKAQPLHDNLISEKLLFLNVTNVQAPKFGNKTNLRGNVKELAERQSFTLYCHAVGMPSPKILWFKDKKPIKVKENFEILDGNRTLEFKYVTSEDDGVYTCVATNRGGKTEATITLNLLDKPKGVNVALVVGLLVLAVFMSIVILYLFLRVRREQKLRQKLTQAGLMHFEDGAIENLNMELGVEDQAELLPYDRKFEFPREKLKLGKTLGSGAFGVVVKADAHGIVEGEAVTPVAVKMVKSSADNAIIKALASELKIMVHLGRHLNVVNLLGACTKSLNKMELMVIVEYCRYGNLHNYLMRHRKLFIDQIDPSTGLIDPLRGLDTLSQFANGRNRLNYAALSFSNSGLVDTLRGVESPMESRNDYRCQSDSSENFVTGATEATFLSTTPTGEESFLMSNNSALQPDWRSNYKGDYKGTVNPITTRDLLCYAFQVSRGMEYLASRKVLHGDLAARNVLLAENNIIKICDFGLAKSVYKDDNYCKKENGPLPIKWMAIESIRDRVFSTQSDVWSFGIVLWEFFTLARTPYPGMRADEHMYKKLEDGYRMEKPPYSTDELYTVMMDCWRARPTLRPSFTELVERLGSMLEDSVRKHYVDLNEPYVQMNTRWQKESGHNDYLGMLSSPNYSNVMSPLPVEEEEPQRYQNIPRGAPTVVADNNIPGYLTMSPSDPNDIFSPTRTGDKSNDNIFKFHTPPQARKSLRDTEVNDHIELRPMLSGGSGHESDSDGQYTAIPSDRPVIQTTEKSPSKDQVDSASKSQSTGFSNPSYSLTPNLITSQDNYVNYPQQRCVNSLKPPDGLSNMPSPTFSTFGRKPANDVQLPSYYANVPSQRAPLALSEVEFDDPPYVN